jgi:DNA helicase II / ATP-dependent DNA helicase PcrA
MPSLKESLKSTVSTVNHVIVEARAGTGKTTTLIEGLGLLKGQKVSIKPSKQQQAVWDELLKSSDAKTITFAAFNKSITSELQEKVPQGVQAMTMHSLGFKSVQNTFGRVKPDSWRTSNLISKVMGKDIRELQRNDPETFNAIGKLVSLVKQNLAEEDQYDDLCSHYDIELKENRSTVYEVTSQVIEKSKDVSEDQSCHFDDMIWLPVVLGLHVVQQDLLLVDEAQDLNRCQQALAMKAGKRLVLVGDPKQAIYGFAGADSQSMSRMEETLQGTKQGCTTLPLTVTRRCGKAIVEEAKKIVPDFGFHKSNGKGLVSHRSMSGPPFATSCDGNPGGTKLQETGYKYMAEDGDMILCRCNGPLVSECFKLLNMGKKATIQGRDIGRGLSKIIHTLVKQHGRTYCDSDGDTSTSELINRLQYWTEGEIEKEQVKKNPNENKIILLQDKNDCIVSFCSGVDSVGEVLSKIEEIFSDEKSEGIKLSSIHRAKGLESNRVFFLMPKEAPCPHPMAKTAWAQEQEMNLKYVGITRAIKELIYVA